jgi:hypothetical protein
MMGADGPRMGLFHPITYLVKDVNDLFCHALYLTIQSSVIADACNHLFHELEKIFFEFLHADVFGAIVRLQPQTPETLQSHLPIGIQAKADSKPLVFQAGFQISVTKVPSSRVVGN